MKLYTFFLNFIMNDNCLHNYIHNYIDNNLNNNLNNDLNKKILNFEKKVFYNDYLNIKNDKKIDIINLFLKMELLKNLEKNTSTENKLKCIEGYEKNFKKLDNTEIIHSINITNGGLYNDWNFMNFE
jgi:hypothetical protein